MTDVALITNIPTPYREGLFEQLADHETIDLTVYYCAESFPGRSWSVDTTSYDAEFLPGRSHGRVVFNPSVVPRILDDDCDVIIVGGYSTPTALLSELTAAVTNTPLIIWVESHLWDERNQAAPLYKSVFKRLFVGGVLKLCDGYLVPGNASREYVVHYGAAPDAVFTAPTTCDVEWFDAQSSINDDERGTLRDEFGIEEQRLTLYVGRIAEKKGVESLLRGYRMARGDLEDVGLVVVGTGPQQEELAAEYDDDGIYWLGYQPDDRLPTVYGLADLFACPSLGDQWAVVVNEAMACRLPIVTTRNVGAAHDLVHPGENGWIIDAGDSAALSDVLREAFGTGSPILTEMGRQSRQQIAEYTHDRTVEGFVRAVEWVS